MFTPFLCREPKKPEICIVMCSILYNLVSAIDFDWVFLELGCRYFFFFFFCLNPKPIGNVVYIVRSY